MESLKKYNDWENVLEFAQKKGYKKAALKYEELLKEEKKRAEEEKKRAEIEHQKLVETAKFLKSLHVSMELIMEKTGLTQEEIEKL